MIRRGPPRAAKTAKQPTATPQEHTSKVAKASSQLSGTQKLTTPTPCSSQPAITAATKPTALNQRNAAQQVKVAKPVKKSSQSEAAINSRALKAVGKSGQSTPPHPTTRSDNPITKFIALSRGSTKTIKISNELAKSLLASIDDLQAELALAQSANEMLQWQIDSEYQTNLKKQGYFVLFPKLPIELRLQIWQLALPGPRIIDVFYLHPKGARTTTPIPFLLHVCQESRREAQRVFLAFNNYDGDGYFYVNPKTDTIWLRGKKKFTERKIDVFNLFHRLTRNKLLYPLKIAISCSVWFSYDIDELIPWLIWWNLSSISLVLTDENFGCLSGTRNIRLVEEISGDAWGKLDLEIEDEDILDQYDDLSWEEARDEAQNQLQLGKAILMTKKMAEISSSCTKRKAIQGLGSATYQKACNWVVPILKFVKVKLLTQG